MAVGEEPIRLQQTVFAEACMLVPRNDEMIVQAYADAPQGLCEEFRRSAITSRGLTPTARVVLDEDDARCIVMKGFLDHFARINGRMVDGAMPMSFICDQFHRVVQEQNTVLPYGLSSQDHPRIADQCCGIGENGATSDVPLRQSQGDDLQPFQKGHGVFKACQHLFQPLGWGADDVGEATELVEQAAANCRTLIVGDKPRQQEIQ